MLGRIGYGGRVELESMDVHIQSRAAGVRVVGLGQVRAGAGCGSAGCRCRSPNNG